MSLDGNPNNDYDNFETPKEVYQRLMEVMTNEMHCPEVLPYEESVVDCLVEQMEHMSGNLRRLSSKLDQLCVEHHAAELERFSYVVHQYLRSRLVKIERYSHHLIRQLHTNRQSVLKLLSNNEIKYLDNYVAATDSYLNDSVLAQLPFNRTSVMSYKSIDVPNGDDMQYNNTYVFVKALKATQVLVDDPSGQQTVSLERGSQHFLPYSCIRRHLMSRSRDLALI